MKQEDQQDQFQDEMTNIINRFSTEYDLTYASMVGVMEVIKFGLLAELQYHMDEGEDEEY
tara:strand:- start:372 stop:551 length:180 start_codon:yes stop_codon:yes gene_type:complete